MTKLSEDLLNGFESVSAKTSHGLQVCTDLTTFLKAKAALDKSYGDQLKKLCTQQLGSGMFSKDTALSHEQTTLREAIQSIQDETAKLAQAYIDSANKTIADVATPIESFHKTKDTLRKKNVVEGQNKLKNYQALVSVCTKAKEAYLAAGKAYDTAKDQEIKAKQEAEAADEKKKKAAVSAADKADANSKKAQLKLDQTEKALRDALKKSNEAMALLYDEDLPKLLDLLQKLEEDRSETILSSLKAYLEAQSAVPTQHSERLDAMREKLDAVDADADLKEFVDALKATEPDQAKPEETKFERFESKHGDVVLPSETKAEAPAASAPVTPSTPAAAAASAPASVSETAVDKKEGDEEEDIF